MRQPSKLTPEQIEERRTEGGRLLREGGLSQAEIARRLGVSRRAVSQWARQIKQRRCGLKSLKRIEGRVTRRRPGVDPALNLLCPSAEIKIERGARMR
jgi:predicted transcriptional regulator